MYCTSTACEEAVVEAVRMWCNGAGCVLLRTATESTYHIRVT